MYEALSALMFLILFGIWTKANFYNLLIKIVFLALFVYGGLEALVEFGYIVHLGGMQ